MKNEYFKEGRINSCNLWKALDVEILYSHCFYANKFYKYRYYCGQLYMLHKKGYMSYDTYIDLCNKDFDEQIFHIKNIRFGNENSKEITKFLRDDVIELRKDVFSENELIRKDIALLNEHDMYTTKPLAYLGTEERHYTLMAEYTDFMRLADLDKKYRSNDILVFCQNSKEYGNIGLEFIGIDHRILPLHENYMIAFIQKVCSSLYLNPISETVSMIKDFIDRYVNKDLPIGFYREFCTESRYLINIESRNTFKLDYLDECDKKYVSGSYNLKNIIMPIQRVVGNIVFNSNDMRERF